MGRPPGIVVRYEGASYPAEEVARGAAFELFADQPAPGFLPNPRPGARWRYRRFVHATDALAAGPDVAEPLDEPLVMPVSRLLEWSSVHRMSQTPIGGGAPHAGPIAAIRRSATIKRGTQMIKFLSARQLAGHLRGWLPCGFCYRLYDVAHLRTPADLVTLLGDSEPAPGATFAMRWRAVDPLDYELPFDLPDEGFGGLVTMPPHDRVGPPVVGTAFAPAERHLVPEWVTADLADLPLSAGAKLVAYTDDGTEVTLYTYLPEQRAWSRMYGPQWRHLLARVPWTDGPFPLDQDFFPIPAALARYVGRYRDQLYDAIADPPDEFRVAAKTRAARYPVDELARRTPYATWRGARCTVVRAEGDWLRLRPCRPDADLVAKLGAHCVERGVYETWAPAAEIVDGHESDVWFEL
jgi:hypothetical protein